MIQVMIAAACGWFLLVPQIIQTETFTDMDYSRPFVEWDQKGAFDTVKECESEKKVLIAPIMSAISKRAEEQKGKVLTKAEGAGNALLWAQLKARCIPSDVLLSPQKR